MLIVIFLIFFAVLLVYLSNKHQRFSLKSLPHKIRLLSLLFACSAFALLMQEFSLMASIAYLTLLLMVFTVLIPMIALAKGSRS